MNGDFRYEPYPEYKPSGIVWLGDVPAHWEVRRLRNAVDMRVSNVDKHIKDGEMPVRLCNYVDVYKNERITDDIPFMQATATASEVGRFRLELSDVLITKDSETWDDIGVPALVDYAASDLICGYHLAMLRPMNLSLEGGFLLRVLQSSAIGSQFYISASGVTRYGLTHEAIKSVILPVPPLDEQTAIVRYLDRADGCIHRAISAKERLIELLTEQRQAVIHRAVTRGLDPDVQLKDSGVEWLGDVPEHWEVRRLRHTGEAIIGLTYSPQDVVDEGAGTLVLRASNIFEGQLNYQDSVFVNCPIPERLVVKVGDILLCSRSGSRALIGKNAKIDSEAAGTTFGAFMTVFRSHSNDYLHHVFNSKLFENQSGAFLTSTINQLTLGILNDFKVPRPPSEEQTAIVRYLDKTTADIDTAIDKAQRQIDLLREYRTRLIADVVTGQLDVRGAGAVEVELPVS